MKKIILLFMVLLANIAIIAQTEKKKSLFSKVVNYIESSSLNGYDTTYIGLPKHKWLTSISANFAGIKSSVIGSDLPNYGDVDIDLRSSLAGQSTVYLGYRWAGLSYSFDLIHGYSSNISLSLLQQSWGIEYRRHSTNGVHGSLSSSTTGKSIGISEDDINVKSTLVDGYMILNYSKYIYSGTGISSLIQRRSAGSLLLVGGYINSKVTANDAALMTRLNGIKKIDITQGTVGIGYGYNYSINNGKVIIYTSAIPMVVIHNNDLITFDYTTKLADGTSSTMEFSKKIKSDNKVHLTGIVRLSADYNISDRFVLRLDGIFNDIRFKSDDGISLKTQDWYCDIKLGVRF